MLCAISIPNSEIKAVVATWRSNKNPHKFTGTSQFTYDNIYKRSPALFSNKVAAVARWNTYLQSSQKPVDRSDGTKFKKCIRMTYPITELITWLQRRQLLFSYIYIYIYFPFEAVARFLQRSQIWLQLWADSVSCNPPLTGLLTKKTNEENDGKILLLYSFCTSLVCWHDTIQTQLPLFS